MGTAAIVIRNKRILLGQRLVAHGTGTWAAPGGKVEAGEDPAETVVRELLEETGLVTVSCSPLTWTNDIFVEQDLHYVTLFFMVEAIGKPVAMEPEKCAQWLWFEELPSPLFPTITRLLEQGWHL